MNLHEFHKLIGDNIKIIKFRLFNHLLGEFNDKPTRELVQQTLNNSTIFNECRVICNETNNTSEVIDNDMFVVTICHGNMQYDYNINVDEWELSPLKKILPIRML